jgi:hypothetical protein
MLVRHHLSRAYAQRYRLAARRRKHQMLDEFCTTTGYNRKYAPHLLTHWSKCRYLQTPEGLLRLKADSWAGKPARVGRPFYGPELDEDLAKLWVLFQKSLRYRRSTGLSSLATTPRFSISSVTRRASALFDVPVLAVFTNRPAAISQSSVMVSLTGSRIGSIDRNRLARFSQEQSNR